MITIGMPTLNAAEFLAESIDSILGQDYKNWKLYIVDAGSTDGTIELAEHYAGIDERVNFVLIPKIGIAEARDWIIKNTESKFICWQACDDVMTPDRLSRSLKTLDKARAAIVYSDYIACDYKLRPMETKKYPKIEQATLDQVLENQLVPHDTLLAKRKCFEQFGYRTTRKTTLDDDHYVIASLFKAGFKFKKMSKPVLWKRYHDNQHYRVHYDEYVAESKKIKEIL